MDQNNNSKVFNNNLSNLNLDQIAYKSDYDFFKSLPEKTSYLKAIEEINKLNSAYNSRRSLLSTAMRLSESVSKPVFKILAHCQKTLDFKAPIELFVVQDGLFNAAVMPMVDERIIIYFTSSLLEKFSENELAFVLGHEMGHAMFGHINVPVNQLMGYGHVLSGRDLIKLKSWQRAAELSADRAGLLCAQDYNAACSAFFKLSSGITSQDFKFNVNEYMVQFADLEHYLKNTTAQNVNEVYSTHPLNPIRLKALDIFQQSNVFADLVGHNKNVKLNQDQAEVQIKSFMDIMEPNYLDDESKIAEKIREFMFLSSYMIASADSVISDAEIDKIVSLTNKASAKDDIAKLETEEKQSIIDKIKALSDKIIFELTYIQRTNIVSDLFVVATADNSISNTEITTMCNICMVLGVDTYFVDELLRNCLVPIESNQPVAA